MWERMYEEFWDKLEHFCYKLCREESRAEDLTQEVFLKALQNRALIESFTPGQCKAWLFAAARNLYCDQVRRAVKEKELLASLLLEGDEPPDADAEAALGEAELEAAVLDLRYLSEETLAGYDKIKMQAALVLTGPAGPALPAAGPEPPVLDRPAVHRGRPQTGRGGSGGQGGAVLGPESAAGRAVCGNAPPAL